MPASAGAPKSRPEVPSAARIAKGRLLNEGLRSGLVHSCVKECQRDPFGETNEK